MKLFKSYTHDIFGTLRLLADDKEDYCNATDILRIIGCPAGYLKSPRVAINFYDAQPDYITLPSDWFYDCKGITKRYCMSVVTMEGLRKIVVGSHIKDEERLVAWLNDEVFPDFAAAIADENGDGKSVTPFYIKIPRSPIRSVSKKRGQRQPGDPAGVNLPLDIFQLLDQSTDSKQVEEPVNEPTIESVIQPAAESTIEDQTIQLTSEDLPFQEFFNDEFGNIRGAIIDNEPWLVGKDVALALGYSNPQKAIRDHVDEEDRGVNEMDTPGGKQNLVVINESGLYSLIFSSKLPSAKRFKRWITSEVLPALREHGSYSRTDTDHDSTQTINFDYNKMVDDVTQAVWEKMRSSQEFRSYRSTTRSASRPLPFGTQSVAFNGPAMFKNMGGSKAQQIADMYGTTSIASLSCIYRRMQQLGVNFDEIRRRSNEVNPQIGDSVLNQLSILPEYHTLFFHVADEVLSMS